MNYNWWTHYSLCYSNFLCSHPPLSVKMATVDNQSRENYPPHEAVTWLFSQHFLFPSLIRLRWKCQEKKLISENHRMNNKVENIVLKEAMHFDNSWEHSCTIKFRIVWEQFFQRFTIPIKQVEKASHPLTVSSWPPLFHVLTKNTSKSNNK